MPGTWTRRGGDYVQEGVSLTRAHLPGALHPLLSELTFFPEKGNGLLAYDGLRLISPGRRV